MKLSNHQLGREHSKHAEFMRRAHYQASVAEDGKYRCPYSGCGGVYTNINKLTEHVRNSEPAVDGNTEEATVHDAEKRADGWYDEDFSPPMTVRKPAAVRDYRRRHHGLRYSDMEELPGPVTISYSGGQAILGDAEGITSFKILERSGGTLVSGGSPGVMSYQHPVYSISTAQAEDLRLGSDSGSLWSAGELVDIHGGALAAGDRSASFKHSLPHDS